MKNLVFLLSIILILCTVGYKIEMNRCLDIAENYKKPIRLSSLHGCMVEIEPGHWIQSHRFYKAQLAKEFEK